MWVVTRVSGKQLQVTAFHTTTTCWSKFQHCPGRTFALRVAGLAIRGEHHLIGHDVTTAAMRCFIASFMGLMVEIPADVSEELASDALIGH